MLSQAKSGDTRPPAPSARSEVLESGSIREREIEGKRVNQMTRKRKIEIKSPYTPY